MLSPRRFSGFPAVVCILVLLLAPWAEAAAPVLTRETIDGSEVADPKGLLGRYVGKDAEAIQRRVRDLFLHYDEVERQRRAFTAEARRRIRTEERLSRLTEDEVVTAYVNHLHYDCVALEAILRVLLVETMRPYLPEGAFTPELREFLVDALAFTNGVQGAPEAFLPALRSGYTVYPGPQVVALAECHRRAGELRRSHVPRRSVQGREAVARMASALEAASIPAEQATILASMALRGVLTSLGPRDCCHSVCIGCPLSYPLHKLDHRRASDPDLAPLWGTERAAPTAAMEARGPLGERDLVLYAE